ncbi:MoaD/ThiS family protein [Limibacillus halophilus]|jgi:molybdopterin synthase sulfur carrier subunit
MVKVTLQGGLKAAAGGKAEFEVEASTIRELVQRLEEAAPELKPALARGVAVSVDGRIYRDSWFQPITPESEVFVFSRMAGG